MVKMFLASLTFETFHPCDAFLFLSHVVAELKFGNFLMRSQCWEMLEKSEDARTPEGGLTCVNLPRISWSWRVSLYEGWNGDYVQKWHFPGAWIRHVTNSSCWHFLWQNAPTLESVLVVSSWLLGMKGSEKQDYRNTKWRPQPKKQKGREQERQDRAIDSNSPLQYLILSYGHQVDLQISHPEDGVRKAEWKDKALLWNSHGIGVGCYKSQDQVQVL